MYRVIGDRIGTFEARDLAEQLVAWHDAMVKHLRSINLRGVRCADGCPHEEARGLWPAALDRFGDEARRLAFLRAHGAATAPPRARGAGAEMHA